MQNGLVSENKALRVPTPSASQNLVISRQVHGPGAFQRLVAYERARADRSGLPFSIVVVLPRTEGQAAHRQQQEVLQFWGKRLRNTDDIGWIDSDRLAALLPYTSAQGAWTVADTLVAALSTDDEPPLCEVWCYPSQWPADFADAGDDSQAGSRPFRPLQPSFARPLPWWKRLLDLAGASAGLVALMPLFLLVAVVQKITSPGPLLFKQKRAGLGGKPFEMLKFRTMIVNAEAKREELLALNEQDGPAFKVKNDPRVTPFGRLLRKTSIDELPQLWNVLRGEMSLVGPRPLPCFEAEACELWQQRRQDVTPGLTCLWQVYGRSQVSFAEWMRLDIRYLISRNLWRDIKLILLTIPAVLWRRGAH